MKMVGIEEVNGETEITVETGWLLKRRTTYRTSGRVVGHYYNWLKMPNMTMVPDVMSFQLDEWKKLTQTYKE